MKLEAKVGTLFIISMFIFGILILRMEKIDVFSRRSQSQFVTHFEQVAGLNVKSAVRVAGIQVGTVTSIDLNGNNARITLGLPKKLAIHRDALASLGSIGILGEKYINLDTGHPTSGMLPEGGVIPSKNSVSLDTLTETIADISKDIKNVTASLNETIGSERGQQQIGKIIDNIYRLTSEFRAIVNENHKNIDSTVTNLRQLSTDLTYGLPKAVDQFNELGKSLNEIAMQNKPELQAIVANMRKLTTDLQGASCNILSITNNVNSGKGTIGRLINDESTIDKINLTADHINSMLGSVKNLDLNLDLSATRWTKRDAITGGISVDILPSHNYWYNFALNNTPDGKINVYNIASDNDNDLTKNSSSTTMMTTRQTFTITAQFAKRLAEHFVLTAGIIENSGGCSIELRTMNDKLRFGLTGYDFNRRNIKPKPRYRITSSYQFYKEGYVQMGIQDFANPKLRTFCLGGGLRWQDEDLKKLVGVASLKR